MLWIRIGFNADPDPPFFYLNADLDTDPEPESQQTYLLTRVNCTIFTTKIYIFDEDYAEICIKKQTNKNSF